MAEETLAASSINYKLDKFDWRIDYRTETKNMEEKESRKINEECLLLEFTLSNREAGGGKEPFILEVKKDDFAKIHSKIEDAKNELLKYSES